MNILLKHINGHLLTSKLNIPEISLQHQTLAYTEIQVTPDLGFAVSRWHSTLWPGGLLSMISDLKWYEVNL